MTQYGNYIFHPSEVEHTPTKFDDMPDHKLDAIVNRAAMSNQDRTQEALTKADAFSFQVVNPQFKRTAKNVRVMNHQLTSWGITHPTYEDFARAYDALNEGGLLDIDDTKEAPRTFTGTFSKQTFNNVETLILQERHAAINSMTVSSEEIALEKIPLDSFKDVVRGRERDEKRKVDGHKTAVAGDAWLTQHPEFRDNHYNAKLMRQQLATNGVLEDAATIPDYETAYHQLRASGLLSLDKVELNKQRQEALSQEAAEALKPGPTEEEMYNLPMEELEKRARGWS
ncbi:MAG TPA: hypothetical protein VHV10_13755 [Ktedonobacteraceae bacterium]|jgi:hypothetical protein|nr:hypothetical protein [Ktedonobacteraceae bacterium]